DGLLPLRPVPAHRPRRLDDAAVDGHAAAAAGDDLAAVQDPAVRDGRRLESAGVLDRPELRLMSDALVVGIVRHALEIAVLLTASMQIAGLLAVVAVSIFQTITSIQDNVLAFIPRAVAIFAVFALTFPWMLRVLAGFTHQLIARLPELI